MSVFDPDETHDLSQIETQAPPADATIDLGSVLGEELPHQESLIHRLWNASDSGEDSGKLESGKYDVQHEVGRGGMGKILEVRDNDLNRNVAMKVLLRDEADPGGSSHLRRFIEEAQITGQLEHPNVLPVHELGINPSGDLFFTMQYVKGHTTLRQVIDALKAGDAATHEQFSFERRVQVVQQVCHALHYAHRRGVVHRDIKPDNIVLGAFGEVYLVDWGVAKLLTKEQLEEGAVADLDLGGEPIETVRTLEEFHATQDGSWIGTPAYMSPEQVMGKQSEVRPASDIYSLTAVLYELLCLHHYLDDGKAEARKQSVREMVASVLTRKPIDAENYLDRRNGRVPRQLSRICRKGLAKRPAARWHTTLALEQSLQLWVEGRAPVVCPGTLIQRNLSRWSWFIDRYPVLGPVVSITSAVVLLAGTITSLVLLVRMALGA